MNETPERTDEAQAGQPLAAAPCSAVHLRWCQRYSSGVGAWYASVDLPPGTVVEISYAGGFQRAKTVRHFRVGERVADQMGDGWPYWEEGYCDPVKLY